jgi:hypothetical protein
MIALDMKDLYVNLPAQNILHITKFWLNKHNNINTITEETLYLLKVTLKQNYFSKITNFSKSFFVSKLNANSVSTYEYFTDITR